jgi:DNA polymerase sigma
MGVFAFVWIYCLIFWLLQDFLKVLLYRFMYKTNALGIKSTGKVELPESAKQLIAELSKALGETKEESSESNNDDTGSIKEQADGDIV